MNRYGRPVHTSWLAAWLSG